MSKMAKELSITPPFFEVDSKVFCFGKKILNLATFANDLSLKYQVQILFSPQYVDIPILAQKIGNIFNFCPTPRLVKGGPVDGLGVTRGIENSKSPCYFADPGRKTFVFTWF